MTKLKEFLGLYQQLLQLILYFEKVSGGIYRVAYYFNMVQISLIAKKSWSKEPEMVKTYYKELSELAINYHKEL